MFTTEMVSFPNCVHIGDDKDFTPVIEHGIELGGYGEVQHMTGMNGGSTMTTGFAQGRETLMPGNGASRVQLPWQPVLSKGPTMTFYTEYETDIIGTLTLAGDDAGIVGCWFNNDRYFGCGVDGPLQLGDDLPVFAQARTWLDRYFAGQAPDPRELPLTARATEFQMRVRQAMLDIPYGTTTTYGAIAARLERETGRRQSARAVGGAVGHNPLCLIVPCHRVVGASGSLTGFGGGIDMKVKLLEFEGAMKDSFTRPKKGTALAGAPNAARDYFGTR